MNHIKICLYSSALLFSAFIFAQEEKPVVPAEPAKAETTQEIKLRLASNVVKSENGDVVINFAQATQQFSEDSMQHILIPSLRYYLDYIVPSLGSDEEFVKATKLPPANKTDKPKNLRLKQFDLVEKYLYKAKKLKFSEIKYSQSLFRKILDSGSPVFFSLPDLSGAFDTFEKRNEERKAAQSPAAWAEYLKKNKIKGFSDYKSSPPMTCAFLVGYNASSNEYLYCTMKNKSGYWLTEEEFRTILKDELFAFIL